MQSRKAGYWQECFCPANSICKEPEEDPAYCPAYGEASDDYAAVPAEVCSNFSVEQVGQPGTHDREEHHRVQELNVLFFAVLREFIVVRFAAKNFGLREIRPE